MKFSAAKAKITPTEPIPLGGYGGRKNTFEGIRDDIYVRALVLRDDTANRELLLLSYDVTGLSEGFVIRAKAAICEAHGLDSKNILMVATHSHASASVADGCYADLVAEITSTVVADAFSSLVDGTISIGTGETWIGMSRRHRDQDGSFRLGPNPDAEIDRTLTVIRLTAENDGTQALLFSCPCHATVMGADNLLLSGDFPGRASRRLEESTARVAMFLPGAGGDVNPAIKAEGDTYRTSSFSDVDFTGDIIANDVRSVLKCGTTRVDFALQSAAGSVSFAIGAPETSYFESLQNERRAFRREYGRRMLQRIAAGDLDESIEFTLGLVHLSSRVRLVLTNAELCNHTGARLDDDFDGHTLTIPYTNGYATYIPSPQIQSEGGYEASSVYSHAGKTGGFYDIAEDVLVKSVRTLNNALE